MSLDASALRNAGRDLQKKSGAVGGQTSRVVRATAFKMEGTSKRLAPVDTGFLRSSISTEINGDGRYREMEAIVGPTADYGIWQEIGTSTQPGQPYLAPSFDQHIGPCQEALARIAGEVW